MQQQLIILFHTNHPFGLTGIYVDRSMGNSIKIISFLVTFFIIHVMIFCLEIFESKYRKSFPIISLKTQTEINRCNCLWAAILQILKNSKE